MRVNPPACLSSLLLALLCLPVSVSRAQDSSRSWLGDAGHFMQTLPRMYANNPAGKAFTVTVHRHVWKAAGDWPNRGDYAIRILGPDGKVRAKGAVPSGKGSATLQVPAGTKGVHEIEVKTSGYSLTWVETSLAQLVAVCEPFESAGKRPFQLHVVAPRRWYFYVPEGVRSFQIRHEIQTGQTHREDFGFFVVSPRGQRVEAVFGGKSLEMSPTSGTRPGFPKPLSPVPVTRTIETDPGTAGRFWSLWLTSGDSHNYSDLQVQFNGVPPYLAASPEQWFDPQTGLTAPTMVYDDTLIRHPDSVDAEGKVRPPYPRYFCTPAPFLGDEDYNGWRGPHTVWLSNPKNRKIEFGVQTYLAPLEDQDEPVAVRVTGPGSKALIELGLPLGKSVEIPSAGAGVYRVDCDGRRWFPWIHPAPPTVLQGQATRNGGGRFALETGIPRHWFFNVPAGTKQFKLAAKVLDLNHVLRIEVQAPDRIQEELVLRGGARREIIVTVDPRLAGRIWFLRTEVGSASRFPSGAGNPTQLNINVDLELHGVPGFLAPTWEQWFDPTQP